MNARSLLPRIACGLALAASGGCLVGPDYVAPPPPSATRWTREDLPELRASGEARSSASESDAWWKSYGSPRLDEVVALALDSSPSLEAARARWKEAREAVVVARGAALPAVDIGIVPRGNRFRSAWAAGGVASFSADIFGGVRRDIERSRGLADAQREELAATRLVLAGNAVAGAIAIASLGEQREALAEQVRADDERAALLSAREEAGRAARTDVLAARLDAERSRAQLPALEQQLAAARNALAVTCGQLPAEWESPDFTLEELQLPRPVPGEIPSELVHRRPDILAAEQRLHAANAQIGVATAALYPRLDITGALGVKLEGGGGVAAAVGGQLIEPLVHGGALRAARRGAIEAHAAAFADYRATVLAGFQQVADALLALAHDAQAHEAAARALDIASQALALEQTRYDAGKVDALAVLEARRSLGQVRGELARARAQHLADAATLFVAMGGGAR